MIILEGKNGHAQKFGEINYYEEKELLEWSYKSELENYKAIAFFHHVILRKNIIERSMNL